MKILIVEDEMIISEDICMMLEDRGYEVCGQAVDYDEAIDIIKNDQPDLALLDINLNGSKDGVEVAKSINQIRRIPFIFTSSIGDTSTIVRAKSTHPSAYILKPFKEEQLFAAIEVAMENFSVNENTNPEEQLAIFNDAIFVKSDHRFIKVSIDEIRYIQKSDNYIDLHSEDKTHIIRSTISGFVNKLASDKIIRTHRSYAVNLDHVSDVGPNAITIGDTQVPLAKNYPPEIMPRLRTF